MPKVPHRLTQRILVLTHFTCPTNTQVILNGGLENSAGVPTLGTESMPTRCPAVLSPCTTVSNLDASNLQTTRHLRPSGVLGIVIS